MTFDHEHPDSSMDEGRLTPGGEPDDKNRIFASIDQLARAVAAQYSVTDAETILAQYLEQVRQYPLYKEWFERVDSLINNLNKQVSVLELGSGPGILAGRLGQNSHVETLTTVEPNQTFREMTQRESPKAKVLDGTAETYIAPESTDIIVATAAYHHFVDKLLALQNIYKNLRPGGKLVVGEVFLPDYEFDGNYNPKNQAEFINSVVNYTAEQIRAMPNPSNADVADQIRTALLDSIRVDELKVCLPIILEQLNRAGFQNISAELMQGDDKKIDYRTFGWYFITAEKPA